MVRCAGRSQGESAGVKEITRLSTKPRNPEGPEPTGRGETTCLPGTADLDDTSELCRLSRNACGHRKGRVLGISACVGSISSRPKKNALALDGTKGEAYD